MNSVRNEGFLKAKIDELSTGNINTVISEDYHNIAHYLRKFGPDAPTPVFLYVAKSVIQEGETFTYFMKATNMPHTYDIYMNKLTPYAKKETPLETQTQASIDSRGYGAILPFLYIGGTVYIQFINEENKTSQLISNIEQLKKIAMTDSGQSLPIPHYTEHLLPTDIKYLNFENFWGPEVMQFIRQNQICTCEVSVNPTFNHFEDLVNNKQHFQNFLEGIQTQFEELFIQDKVKVSGFWYSSFLEKYLQWNLPHNFIQANYSDEKEFKHTEVPDTCLSAYGINNLVDEYTLFFNYRDKSDGPPTLHWKYISKENKFYYGKFDWKGYVDSSSLEPIADWIDDFSITYGRLPKPSKQQQNSETKDAEMIMKYCSYLTLDKVKDTKHPLYASSVEDFADGVLVNINGYRTTLKPNSHDVFKVANTVDKSSGRMLLDILSEFMKRKYYHAKDWKDKSEFRTQSDSNPLIFAIRCMYSIMKKLANESSERSEKRFLDILNKKKKDQEKVKESSLNGQLKEISLNDSCRSRFSNATVVVGDAHIKREILEMKQNEPGYQAIDTLLQFKEEGLWIAIQTKSGERDKPESIEQFIKTFQAIREKGLENNCRTFGILVHYKKLKAGIDKIAMEPGCSLLMNESEEEQNVFNQQICEYIQKILKYY